MPISDPHSYSNPGRVRVRHLGLDLAVAFEAQRLDGVATLTVERAAGFPSGPLILDTSFLTISRVEAAEEGRPYRDAPFEIGPTDAVLGAPLTIDLSEHARYVRIGYATSAQSSALQWLHPAQTAAKTHPFLFTQSQSIHARSWIPLQDSPAARLTYTARVRQPAGLTAVMSAENNADVHSGRALEFRQPRPIPPYLIALAVGDLGYAATGSRTGVYAEGGVLERASYEFGDAARILEAAEELFGPYPWSRFDILVLPPSFPFGGMENPEVIFVTPTLLAGDRSSVSVIAHELAHAWSGNLATNATWSDFWLNEGFTTYVEYRLQEKLYGAERATVERVLDQQRLAADLARLDPRDQILHIDLTGRNPDDGVTRVPYVKGALLLTALEQAFGRERFDAFLRDYFARFSFQSVGTAQALAFIRQQLFDRYPEIGAAVDLDAWVSSPGLPATAPLAVSELLIRLERLAERWWQGTLPTSRLGAEGWTAHEWLYFLKALPSRLSIEQMSRLDSALRLDTLQNQEILQQLLLMAVRNGYQPAFPRLRQFLLTVGRRLFVKPLYEELMKTDAGKQFARSVYREARRLYHPITQAALDAIVNGGSNQEQAE